MYLDFTDSITPELTDIFDRISKKIPGFFFGRYDIRFSTVEGLLKAGEFKILELNGSNSADGWVYAETAPIWHYYSIYVDLFKKMLCIAVENKKRGDKVKSLWQLQKKSSSIRKRLLVAKDERWF